MKETKEAEGTAINMVWEGEVHSRKWIRWTPEREKRLYILAKPAKGGYISRLQCLWNREFPDLITSTVLTRYLYVIRNREKEPMAQTVLPKMKLSARTW